MCYLHADWRNIVSSQRVYERLLKDKKMIGRSVLEFTRNNTASDSNENEVAQKDRRKSAEWSLKSICYGRRLLFKNLYCIAHG